MPLFAFECNDCYTQAELLVSGTGEPLCPNCGSSAVTKLPSVFAPLSGAGIRDTAPYGCGASECCMGEAGCGLN